MFNCRCYHFPSNVKYFVADAWKRGNNQVELVLIIVSKTKKVLYHISCTALTANAWPIRFLKTGHVLTCMSLGPPYPPFLFNRIILYYINPMVKRSGSAFLRISESQNVLKLIKIPVFSPTGQNKLMLQHTCGRYPKLTSLGFYHVFRGIGSG